MHRTPVPALALLLVSALPFPAVAASAGRPDAQPAASDHPSASTAAAASAPFDPRTGFSTWPKGRSPQEVGSAVAGHYLGFPYQGHTIVYPEVCAWYGALTYAQVIHDRGLREILVARFAPLLPGGADAARIPTRRHVDDDVFGVVPLEIAIQTKGQPGYNPEYLKFGLSFADRQWDTNPGLDHQGAAPNLSGTGLSPETRFWTDDMYLLTLLQLEAYRATGDRKYLDRDAHEMVVYLDKLQQPSGLFFHGPDAPLYWGRANGWVAAGMAEMLRTLPPDHPDRPRILAAYRQMMQALLRYQGADGMWRQLLDHPEAWPESSASAMIAFAMITGVRHGWLDAPTYGPAARRAWVAVTGYIDQYNDLTNVSEGTNRFNSVEYYLLRDRRTGDLHGQAAALWAATALLRDEP